jgi:hypothetical protein
MSDKSDSTARLLRTARNYFFGLGAILLLLSALLGVMALVWR